MSILNVEHLTHGFGDRAIFDDVSFRLLNDLQNASEEELRKLVEDWFEKTRTDGMKLGAKFIAAAVFGAIKKNLKFFYDNNLVDANTISSVINFQNIPSRKVFSRNEFERACGQDGRMFHDYIYEL